MHHRFWLAAALAACAAPAAAQPQNAAERPALLNRLFECRNLPGEAERLACYDQAVTAVQAAEASRELVMMDRQQVRRARRSLFGLSLPDLNIFDNDNEDSETVTELTSTIRSATETGNGRWIFTLEDGARWVQIDSRQFSRFPRSGHTIRIRRAAMGSYMANVDGQVAIRVRRER